MLAMVLSLPEGVWRDIQQNTKRYPQEIGYNILGEMYEAETLRARTKEQEQSPDLQGAQPPKRDL
jgi:hypothetical protein